ncbi:MAG: radical SAM family heme chaperone HemW [Planctomycetota bacterium]
MRILRQRPQGSARPPVEATLASDAGPARSLYLHVPFCFHKCHYCDFYSIVDTRDRHDAFTDRLIRELAALAPLARDEPLRTLFVGGGTPTLLRPDLWQRLIAALRDRFAIDGRTEWTVECNPETVTDETAAVLASGGVTRASVGAQTFNTRHLETLERWHEPDSVERAVGRLRDAGINRTSIDLIYAIPGQTAGDLAADLDRAVALGTEHVSAYTLTYEPGTAMTARLAKGEFEPAPEALEIEMFELVGDRLAAAGLERYEISNFARPGAECRHNLAHWRQEPWIAAGPSASAHIGGHRWKNSPRLDDYLENDDDGFAPIIDLEPPDPARALAERIMTGLRLREGLDADITLREAESIRPAAPDRLRAVISEQAALGRIEPASLAGGPWRLTRSGLLFADGIAAELMAAL